MRLKSLLILFFIFISFTCLSGCAGNKKDIFALDQLQAEDGTFQYKDIPFGSSYDEVVKKIPLDFIDLMIESSSASSYRSKDKFEFYGEQAALGIDFIDNQLNTLSITFDLSENSKFEKITQELITLYGEAQVDDIENDNCSGKSYKWQSQDTFLNAMLLTYGSQTICTIGVFRPM